MPPPAGYRLLPHTADLRLQAWAPTREECFAQAVRGLAAAFVTVTETAEHRDVPLDLAATRDEDLLVALLEEALYTVEVEGLVPVAARLRAVDGVRLAGSFDAVPVAGVRLVGSVPKAVSRGDLRVSHGAAGWECLVTVDV